MLKKENYIDASLKIVPQGDLSHHWCLSIRGDIKRLLYAECLQKNIKRIVVRLCRSITPSLPNIRVKGHIGNDRLFSLPSVSTLCISTLKGLVGSPT